MEGWGHTVTVLMGNLQASIPGSEVDICLILSSSQERPRDRISRYLPSRFPVGIDLFAYTRDKFDRLRNDSPQWFAAITSGRQIHLLDPNRQPTVTKCE